MKSDQLTLETILAYVAGDLAEQDRASVEAYLADHPEAVARVSRYRAAKAYRQQDDSVAPPEHVLERARAIYRAPEQPAAPSWLDRIDALVARLVFDSRLQPLGVRYAGSPLRIQLSYEMDDITVDLQADCERPVMHESEADMDERRWRILGQLARIAGEVTAAGRLIRLIDASTGDVAAETTIDDGEMFEFTVKPGRYDLCAELTIGPLVVPGIELG